MRRTMSSAAVGTLATAIMRLIKVSVQRYRSRRIPLVSYFRFDRPTSFPEYPALCCLTRHSFEPRDRVRVQSVDVTRAPLSSLSMFSFYHRLPNRKSSYTP